MPDHEFSIDITNQSVKVRLNGSRNSPRMRFSMLAFFIACEALVICALLFLPGKHGKPSMWHDMSAAPISSGGFIVPLVILVILPGLTTLTTWRYVVSAYPSDEILQADRSTLTISKVRWLDIHYKQWHTRTYALADVANMRYRVIARAGGASIYGLRFVAGGRTQRVLPGIKAHDADKILRTLKALGVGVPEDPALTRKLDEDSSFMSS